MNLGVLKKIIKDGEEFEIYKIKNKVYHKIQYDNKIYTIIESKNGIKFEGE